MRKLVSLLGALALLLALAPSVLAYDHTNYAGRPMDDDSHNGCHGMAYGKVNNALVLFTAWHCNPTYWGGYPSGMPAFGVQGTQIGVWASDWGGASANDLSFIWLDEGQRPYIKNHIYRGWQGGTSNDYWTVNVAYPNSGLSCANIASKFGRTVYHNWQDTAFTQYSYRSGTMTGFGDLSGSTRCNVETTSTWHTNLIDSGSPFVYGALTNQPFGLAQGQNYANGRLWIAPFYDGWSRLNSYWLAHGAGVGAWLCYNEDCT